MCGSIHDLKLKDFGSMSSVCIKNITSKGLSSFQELTPNFKEINSILNIKYIYIKAESYKSSRIKRI